MVHLEQQANKEIMIKTIEQQVIELFKEQLGVKEIALSDSLVQLGADSLDAVELVMAIEDVFHIEVTDEEAQTITSVQSAIDMIKAKK
jgi:acyl carrier protein